MNPGEAFIKKYNLKPIEEDSTSEEDAPSPDLKAILDRVGAREVPVNKYEMHQDISNIMRSPSEIKLHDVTTGLVNPWINLANLIPGMNLHEMSATHPHSKEALMGDVMGTIAPFLTGEGAVAELGSALPKMAESLNLSKGAKPIISPLTKFLTKSSPLRSGLVGASVGAGTSPDQRGLNALTGGVGAGLTHGAGLALGDLLHGIKATPVMKKAIKYFEPPFSTDVPSQAAQNASDMIAGNYVKALKKANDLYGDSLVAADLKGIKFNPNDFKNYTDMYKQQAQDHRLPNNIIHPNELTVNPNEEKLKSLIILPGEQETPSSIPQTLKPSEVHRKRSNLLSQARSSKGDEKRSYNQLANALKTDYIQKMDKIDPRLSNAYLKANDFYRDMIKRKFGDHAAFKKMKNMIDVLPGVSENINDLYNINWHGKSPVSLINNLIPASTDKSVSKLSSLQQDLMGGNHEDASKLAKDLLFSKYTSPLNGEPTPEEIETPNYKFNMYKFLNHYKELEKGQKDFLFSPEEKKTLDRLALHRKKIKKPGLAKELTKKAMGTALGYLLGAHSGVKPSTQALEALAGAMLADPTEKAATSITQAFLPSNLPKLLERLSPYHPSFKTKHLLPGAAIGGLQHLLQEGS